MAKIVKAKSLKTKGMGIKTTLTGLATLSGCFGE